MFCALHLPRFQLQAVLRLQPPLPRGGVVALVDGEGDLHSGSDTKVRLLHASAAAERQGVYPGMTPSQAMARCGRILLLRRCMDAEKSAQRDLQACAAEWTPYYEIAAPGLCLLDLTKVRGLAQEPQTCGKLIHDKLAEKKLRALVGFASNPDLAFLAAQAARPILVLGEQGGEADFLRELPIAALRPSQELAALLTLWGLRQVGQLLALPRTEVSTRLGAEGLLLWDLAAGGRERLLDWVRPKPSYREEMELDYPVETLEPLLFLLRRMIETQCLRLAENWLVASALLLELGFDDKTTRRAELRAAEPMRDADLLLRLIHTHLEGFTAAAPIVKVALELLATRPLASQDQLFERRLRDPNRFAETLAQLEAFLGHGRVGKVRLSPSRHVDAFEVAPFTETLGNSAVLSSGTPGGVVGLPLRRFRPAREVDVSVENGRPVSLSLSQRELPIAESSGPWLFSGEWWDQGAWQREVWEVAAGDGCLYQLAREAGRWVLEGVFG